MGGRCWGILALGYDSTDQVQQGPYKNDQYSPVRLEKACLESNAYLLDMFILLLIIIYRYYYYWMIDLPQDNNYVR